MNAAALSRINDGRQPRGGTGAEFIETNEIPGIVERRRLRPRPVKMIIILEAVIAARRIPRRLAPTKKPMKSIITDLSRSSNRR